MKKTPEKEEVEQKNNEIKTLALKLQGVLEGTLAGAKKLETVCPDLKDLIKISQDYDVTEIGTIFSLGAEYVIIIDEQQKKIKIPFMNIKNIEMIEPCEEENRHFTKEDYERTVSKIEERLKNHLEKYSEALKMEWDL